MCHIFSLLSFNVSQFFKEQRLFLNSKHFARCHILLTWLVFSVSFLRIHTFKIFFNESVHFLGHNLPANGSMHLYVKSQLKTKDVIIFFTVSFGCLFFILLLLLWSCCYYSGIIRNNRPHPFVPINFSTPIIPRVYFTPTQDNSVSFSRMSTAVANCSLQPPQQAKDGSSSGDNTRD